MRKFLQKIKALFTKSDTPKTSLQKTARISIIFAAIALVGAIVYLTVLSPLLKQDENYVPELFEGEVYQNGSIYILRPYERAEIASVEVKNDVDHYKLIPYLGEDGSIFFYLDGNITTTLSQENVSYFLADVRNLITNSPAGEERINAMATEEDLKNYGLDEASDPAWFEVMLGDGSSYRIYVGNALVTSSGYYVRLEGRKNTVDGVEYDIVYALQASLSDTVLASSARLVGTEILPYNNQVYSTTLFSVERFRGEERTPIVVVGLVADQGISASSSVYEMLYPATYVINEDSYGEYVLSNLAYLNADEIVAYGEDVHKPEVYEKYGLDLNLERLEDGTDKNYAVMYFTTEDPESDDYETSLTFLFFSEKQTDLEGAEFYYVYAPNYQVIGKVPATTFEFIEWDLAKYTNPYLFFEYFTSCEYFEIVSEREDLDYRFNLSDKERTRHAEVTTSDGEIVYTLTANGDRIPLVYDAKYIGDATGVEYVGEFERFRDLYYVLITRMLALYADIDENVTTVGDDVAATLTIQTAPKDHPISYYQYDQNGNRVKQLRDEGGNILCHEVIVPTTLSDGSVENITYSKAFYDQDAKRFFLKSYDSNDGNEKPSGYEATDINTVKANTFLPMSAYGTYKETTYLYEFYDLYDEYTDYNGNNVRQLNSTYMYMLPTTVTKTYRLTSGGERELIDTQTERAEEGVYIRTATLDKLFSDTHKLLNGEEIDTMGVN